MSIQDKLFDSLEGSSWHGNYFSSLCPFHNDSRPSMMVYPDYFVCKACGKSGHLQFLERKLKTFTPTYFHAVTKPAILPRWRAWERKYGSIEDIATEAHSILCRNKAYQFYYKKRKIDQFIKQGKFGYLDGWYTFPIFDKNGDIVDLVVRAGKGKGNAKYVLYPISNRETPCLYAPNWQRVAQSDIIYVPFGIIDAWAFEALELAAITGTTGMAINAESLKAVPGYARFYIVPDRYEEKAAWKLAAKLGMRAKVISISYPKETKDPDEIRRLYGENVLFKCL